MNAERMNAIPASPLFRKLNLGVHQEIAVFNAPDSFEPELKRLKGVKIARDPGKPKGVKFALAFAITQAQLDRASKLLAAASEGDAVIWFAYPKGSSKRYACDTCRRGPHSRHLPPKSASNAKLARITGTSETFSYVGVSPEDTNEGRHPGHPLPLAKLS